ncbi:MAG: CGNR zinc finger domain-containing protein [Streptomycetaceae bacterium]|nr:CGNR zinc finger domain-containing protein [Streptomycetaceae bacterium]
MDVNGYRTDGVGTAVALVNFWTVERAAPDAPAVTVEDARELLSPFSYLSHDLSPADVPQLAEWTAELRRVFEADELVEAVELTNALLDRVTIRPRLIDHGFGLHVHYAPSGVPYVERVRINTAIGLATLVAEHGIDRSGVCAADRCTKVYADTSRNGRRRYCSEACANRANVAAHRARKKAAAAAGS